MRTCSPHHADVFSHLPVVVMTELDTPQTAEVLASLVAAGWPPEQLRRELGPYLVAGDSRRSPRDTADELTGRLTALTATAARPSCCALCSAESAAHVVDDDVHLCRRCVAVLATGRARLADTG